MYSSKINTVPGTILLCNNSRISYVLLYKSQSMFAKASGTFGFSFKKGGIVSLKRPLWKKTVPSTRGITPPVEYEPAGSDPHAWGRPVNVSNPCAATSSGKISFVIRMLRPEATPNSQTSPFCFLLLSKSIKGRAASNASLSISLVPRCKLSSISGVFLICQRTYPQESTNEFASAPPRRSCSIIFSDSFNKTKLPSLSSASPPPFPSLKLISRPIISSADRLLLRSSATAKSNAIRYEPGANFRAIRYASIASPNSAPAVADSRLVPTPCHETLLGNGSILTASLYNRTAALLSPMAS
mmetsp:Transcript_2134/g.2888  ORF Transcript_2134/g.2888 Transcript_2134/m.2888 type:complete len:299 (+) Transcript_2134:313-1209(+)